MTPQYSLTMPHNLEAEQSILGCLLFDNASYRRVEGQLKASHFFEPFHGRLFEAIEERLKFGRLAEPVTLVDKFATDKAFQDLGGIRYFADLVDRAPPACNIGDYAVVLGELALRRGIIRTSEMMISDARRLEEGTSESLIAVVEGRVSLLVKGTSGESHWRAGSALAEVIRDKLAGRREGSYIRTGFPAYDRLSGGFRRGRVTVLAGRPSMGKTAVGLEFCRNIAGTPMAIKLDDGSDVTWPAGVAFYSLEMDEEELALRLGCGATFDRAAESGPVYFDIQRDELNLADRRTMERGADILEKMPFYFDDRARLHASQIVATAKRQLREWRRAKIAPGVIMIDHLHLVQPDTDGYGNRAVEIGQVIGALDQLAKETGVAVVVLCQLNRENENRRNADKRPQLSDLKGSGDIEQYANTVVFLYRPEYYLVEPEDKDSDKDMIEYMDQKMKWDGKIQFLFRKNRGGTNMKDLTMRISLPHNALWDS